MNMCARVGKADGFSDLSKDPDQSNIAAALSDAYDRLGAILAEVEESNGLLPAGMNSELITLSGILTGLAGAAPAPGAPPVGGVPAPGQTAAVTPGVPAGAQVYAGQPGTVPLVLSAPAQKRLLAVLSKAELDNFTARTATMNAANERWWKLRGLLEQGNDAQANAEMKGIIEMLTNVTALAPDTATAPPDGAAPTTDVAMSMKQFAKYSLDQLQAATKDTREVAVKRLAHLKRLTGVAKAIFWEDASPPPLSPLVSTFTVETCFAPDGGTAEDLTTKGDQSSQETNITAGVNGPGGDQPGSSPFTKAALEKVGENIDALMKDLGIAPAPVTHPAIPAAGAGATTEVAKSDGYEWPRDMSATVEALPVKMTKRNVPIPARKNDETWGKDPWAKRS